MINCPYNELELLTSLIGAGNKLEAYEKEHGEGSLLTKMESLALTTPPGPGEMNKRIADHNGVSVEVLINSPNNATLKIEYASHMMQKVIDAIKTEFGLEDREAWAIILQEQLTRR